MGNAQNNAWERPREPKRSEEGYEETSPRFLPNLNSIPREAPPDFNLEPRRGSCSTRGRAKGRGAKRRRGRDDTQVFELQSPEDSRIWIVDRMTPQQVCDVLTLYHYRPYDGPRGRDEASKDPEKLKEWDQEARIFLKNLLRKKIPPGLLQSIILENDLEGFDLLLEQGADINLPTARRGSTSLHRICDQYRLKDISDPNHIKRLERSLSFLLSRGADVNVCTNVGLSPLVICARQGWYRGVVLLLEHGANVELSAEGNFTPLFESSKEGHLDSLKLLLRHNADINPVAGNGMTPIWVAANHGREECVSYLLSHGADPLIKVDGHTARDAAKLNGHQGVIDIFDQAASENVVEFESVEDFHKFMKKQNHQEMENRRLREAWEKNPEKHCVHGLRRFITDNSYYCDVCEEAVVENNVMYGCRICDWDKCEACANAVGGCPGATENPHKSLLSAPGMFTENKDDRVRTIFLSNVQAPGSPGEPDRNFEFSPTDSGPDIILSDLRDPGKEPNILFEDAPDIRTTDDGPDIILSDIRDPGKEPELELVLPRLPRTDSGPDVILQAVPGECGSAKLELVNVESTDTCGEPDTLSPGSLRTDDSDSCGEPDIIISNVSGAKEDLALSAKTSATPDEPDILLSPVSGGETP